MAVRIRLLRMGKIRMPQYRIVVADARTKRDGRAIEYVGKYHPKEDPSLIEVNSERVQHWLSVGAQPSNAVLRLLEKTGDWQQFKGLPAPEPLKVAAPKRDKLAVYEAEARATAGAAEAAAKKAEPKADKKKPAKKSDAKAGDAKDKVAAETKAEPGKQAEAKAESGKQAEEKAGGEPAGAES